MGRGPKLLRVGGLPGNAWSSAGTLLVDPKAGQAALDHLTAGLQQLGWPLLLLGAVLPESSAWQDFRAALDRAGMPSVVRPRFRADTIALDTTWEAYLTGRSHNHRRQMRRLISRAADDMQLRVLDRLAPGDVEYWLRHGFAIEDSGWKGRAGSSVLKNPGTIDFYLRQARHLAETGELRLVFLEHQGRPIAFEYGWQAKGVYFSLKIGYDEAFASRKPGRVLRTLLLQQCFAAGDVRGIDLLGPTGRSTHDFATGDYLLARMFIAVNPLGRALLASYRLLQPLVRRFRHGVEESQPLEKPPEMPRDEDSPTPLPAPAGA